MLKLIDKFLNTTTMYRLILYYLTLLFVVALGYSFFGLMPFTPLALIASSALIMAVCIFTNTIFSYIFEAPANVESVYISAFILILILTPPSSLDYFSFLPLAGWAAVWAMASKYILAIRKKHVFNPVAIAVVLTAFGINQSASWWVGGNIPMTPWIILGGLLVVRKIRRYDLMISFFIVSIVTIAGSALLKGGDIIITIQKALLHSPLFFFSFVMLTEPLTTPPTKQLQIIYGSLVGFLFAPSLHLGSIYSTPELALVVGNLFSYLVSPKDRLMLKLKEKILIALDTYDFVFIPDRPLTFTAGQYLEWTLPHEKPDQRGNRRYFTIASSPTESEIHMGVKFYPQASSFKQSLSNLPIGDTIAAGQCAGDFTLPKDKNKKLVFIAGGIGVTPFRSMVKYLLDTREQRSIVFLYSNKTEAEIAYKNFFDAASLMPTMKMVYTLTEQDAILPSWQGERGMIDEYMIVRSVPDYRERIFYLSGPHAMVTAFDKILKNMGVPRNHIKIDFFPGFV